MAMANDSNDFYYELKAHLESFRHQETPHEVPVTIKGVPREGLTIKYQHPSTRPADPADMASEAARVIGAVGIGTAGGAAVGAIIGKVVLGETQARIGVASAGTAIGIPFSHQWPSLAGQSPRQPTRLTRLARASVSKKTPKNC